MEELKKIPVKSINVPSQIEIVDVGVLQTFDENHELLLKSLKVFTFELIFSKQIITNKEDAKSLCISSVNNRRLCYQLVRHRQILSCNTVSN